MLHIWLSFNPTKIKFQAKYNIMKWRRTVFKFIEYFYYANFELCMQQSVPQNVQ